MIYIAFWVSAESGLRVLSLIKELTGVEQGREERVQVGDLNVRHLKSGLIRLHAYLKT